MKKMKIVIFLQIIFSIVNAQFDWVNNGVPVRQGVHIEWQRSGDVSSDGDMIFAWSEISLLIVGSAARIRSSSRMV